MSPLAVALAAVVGGAALAIGAMRWLQRRTFGKWASAGGVAVDANGCVALIRERDRRGRSRWTLPKGRIDPGETPEAAAVREVYEESGLRASIVRPIVVYEGRLHFTYYFEMKVERSDGRPEGGSRSLRLVTVTKATELLRSRRDLSVLRRWLEMRTRVTGSS